MTIFVFVYKNKHLQICCCGCFDLKCAKIMQCRLCCNYAIKIFITSPPTNSHRFPLTFPSSINTNININNSNEPSNAPLIQLELCTNIDNNNNNNNYDDNNNNKNVYNIMNNDDAKTRDEINTNNINIHLKS